MVAKLLRNGSGRTLFAALSGVVFFTRAKILDCLQCEDEAKDQVS